MTGQTITHYHILEKLGEGGMGVVYKARDNRLERLVALKFLAPERVAEAERKRRFACEARTASALNHPNIITIYDIGSAGGLDFIAIEYVAGKTLEQAIGNNPLPNKEVLHIAVEIADALEAAHTAGIIHRDLKPGNVMVTESGRVKVLDFGLAKLNEPATAEGASTATLGVAVLEKTASVYGDSVSVAWLGMAYAIAGRHERARGVLGRLEERARLQHVLPICFAYVHLGLGEDDQASERRRERASASRAVRVLSRATDVFVYRPEDPLKSAC